MHPVWIIAALAGLSVLAVTTLSRRVHGPWAGVVAAAPITPTAAMLLLDVRGVAMAGVPVVSWTVVACLIIVLWVAKVRIPALIIAAVAWAARGQMVGSLAVAVVIAGAGLMLIIGPLLPSSQGRPRLLRVWVRFTLGFGSIILVWTLAHLYPSWASYLTLAPWLFVLGTLATWLDAGPQMAAQVVRGGAFGAVGIVAFAYMVDASTGGLGAAIVLGWLGYTGVSLSLALLTSWAFAPRIRPAPSALPNDG